MTPLERSFMLPPLVALLAGHATSPPAAGICAPRARVSRNFCDTAAMVELDADDHLTWLGVMGALLPMDHVGDSCRRSEPHRRRAMRGEHHHGVGIEPILSTCRGGERNGR